MHLELGPEHPQPVALVWLGRAGQETCRLSRGPTGESSERTPNPRTRAPNATHRPVPLLDAPQPSELEPRESEAAEAPLLDRADPSAEQRSSRSRRPSRSLDVERASLFWVSGGSSRFRTGRRRQTGPSQHPAGGDYLHKVARGPSDPSVTAE